MIKKFDFTSQSPQFFIQKEARLKSTFGGLISLTVISVVLFFIWYLGYDIVYKQNPIVLMKEDNLGVSYQHKFKNSTAFIGLLVENEEVNAVNELEKVLSFSLKHSYYHKNSDKSSDEIWNIRTQEIKLVPCTGYWNFNNSYSEEQLSQFLCGENFNYDLGGYWTEDFLNLLVYEVRFCDPSVRNDCLPKEEMKLFVKGKYLNLYFMDQIVDPTDFDNPIKLFSRNIYMLLDSLLYKEMELFFRTIEINSDIGFFLQEQRIFKTFQYDRFTVDSKSIDEDENPLLASIWVYSSSKKITYRRTYIKVQDIAASVGGIVKFMMLAAHFILYLPSMKAIKVKIMNEIFDFNYEDSVKIIPAAQIKINGVEESVNSEYIPNTYRQHTAKIPKRSRKESFKLKCKRIVIII